MNYGQRFVTLYRRQGLRHVNVWQKPLQYCNKPPIKINLKKKCKKAKWLFEEALQITVKRREVKSKGEKERYTHFNAEFQRIARRDSP